ncbi:MAG TPA: M14 family metallopeptidase [Terriglobales bacterium]|nr:M14 family metallopeptidase [Terriglobales bacterium]
MRFSLVALASLILSLTLQAATFSVGTASAAPGQKSTGYLEVPAGADPGTNIPVVVVNGTKPGPTLALVSGAHGTEYASIIALEGIIQSIDPQEVSGTVVIVPLVNLVSFEKKVPHVNPIDGKSMNRFYPGNPNGTQTERVSWVITKQVVEKCDYLIDLHGGDLDESLRPYAYWSKTGDQRLDTASRGMVLAFGLDHIIVVTDRPRDANASRYLDSTASTRGKPSIAVEAGYAGTTEPDDVQALVDGCFNVMRFLKILPGKAAAIEHPVWISKVSSVTSDVAGIFYPSVERGNYVAQGMKLGYVTDLFGKTIWEAHAPTAGVVLYVCSVPTMNKGDNVANIGEVASEP